MSKLNFTAAELKDLRNCHADVIDAVMRARKIHEAVDARLTEASSSWDEKSERWQEGEKGQKAKEQLDNFEELVGNIEGFVYDVENAADVLDQTLYQAAS